MLKRNFLSVSLGLALLLGACSSVGANRPRIEAETGEPAAPTSAPTSTPLSLAPTLPPSEPTASPTPLATATLPPAPTDTLPAATATSRAPTPLPRPTGAGTAAGTGTPSGETARSVEAGISITPNLGVPGDRIRVDGDGFQPGETVNLHWVALEGDMTAPFSEVEADEDGSFSLQVAVPAAEDWPEGPAQEGEEIQLRATSASLGVGNFYYANFRYLTPFGAAPLALTYENAEYGYSLRLPNGWTWSWSNDDTSNVRFEAGTGGSGFVRVVSGADVDAHIPAVIAEEFPGQSYTVGLLGAGSYPGSQATTGSGRTVQFIPSGGRTYVLSFASGSGQPMWDVVGSFGLR